MLSKAKVKGRSAKRCVFNIEGPSGSFPPGVLVQTPHPPSWKPLRPGFTSVLNLTCTRFDYRGKGCGLESRLNFNPGENAARNGIADLRF